MIKYISILIVVLFTVTINAQDKSTVRGVVTSDKGKPIENSKVFIKDIANGAVTNASGEFEFSIVAEGKKTIVASFIGYKQHVKTITLSKGEVTLVNFKLIEGNNLDEVIVNGKKRHFKNVILESKTALKSNLKLLNTPAAIVSVDKSILEDQGITTMQGTIRNISGVTQAGNNYGIGDNLIIRGLGVNYAYDGMYAGAGLGNSYNPTRTMTNIERIDVLKGPATGLYGMGSAGGVFNMVEKKPLDFQQIEATVSGGNWNYYRVMVDASVPLNDKTSFRVVGAKESTDGYRNVKKDVNEVHASLKYKLTDTNTFILSSSYIDDENQVESIGNPVRIFNRESLANPNDTDIIWEDLINNPDITKGLQLTDAQRKELAESLGDNIGLQPFDLGDSNLISPLSTPNKGKEIRVKLRNDWDITENSGLTQQLMYRTYSSDFTRQTGAFNYVYWNRRGTINANPRSPLVTNGVLYPFAARRQEYRHQESKESSLQYFADFTNKWNLGKIKGEHLASYNYERRDMEAKSWSIYDKDGVKGDGKYIPYILDIRNPNWATGSFWDYDPQLRSNYSKYLDNIGFALQEVVTFDRLTARFGGAFSRIEQNYTAKGTVRNNNMATLPADTNDSGFTYNLGLNYEVIDNLAAFVNYSKGRTAYSITGSIKEEDNRPDSESVSLDAGLRYASKGDVSKLNASVVYFDTRRTNLRRSNPDYNDNVGDAEYNVTVPQYFYDDQDKTEGVELDVNFAINKNWSLNGNGTFQDPITLRKNKKTEAEQKLQTKGVPKRFMRVWGEYRLFLSNLDNPIRFNVGYQNTDERSVNSSGFGLPEAFLPTYSIWDAGVSFKYKKWDLRCVIDNLLDEKYYVNAMFLGGLPGKTRNFRASLKYMF